MVETKTELKTVLQRNVLIQFVIIVFFTITWLTPLLFGFVEFSIGYFLFMFITIIISAIIVLCSNAIQKIPIPKIFTQKITNLLKMLTDIVVKDVGKPSQEFKDIIKNIIILHLRDGRTMLEFDQETLDEAEEYIFNKLFPKEEKGD